MPGTTFDTAIRITHDVTQSIWLGGAVMGATILDTAAEAAPDPEERIHAVGRAWSNWQRISTPVIIGHVMSGAGLTYANKGRLASQAGGGRATIVRTALTATALGTEVACRRLGAAIGSQSAQAGSNGSQAGEDGGDDRSNGQQGVPGEIDDRVRSLQQRLKLAQWANVAAVLTMVAVGARMGEQQRPRELLRGISSRLGLAA